MKITRGFLLILLGALTAACTAGAEVATVTSVVTETTKSIAAPEPTLIPSPTNLPSPTNTLELTPTNTPLPVSLEILDLTQVFDNFGELPSGLMYGDRFNEQSPIFDNGPVPIESLSQLILSEDFHTGIISVFLFEEDEIKSAFALIVQNTLVAEEQEIVIGNKIVKFGHIADPKIGDRSAASYLEEYVDDSLIKESIGTVIQICNVIVSATLSNTNLLEKDVFEYMQSVIEIIDELICNK